MKRLNYKITLCAITLGLLVTSCNDFEEMNQDPNAANTEQVLPEYFLNQSLLGAQMNPDTAERAFVLYWKTAGRQQADSDDFALGSYNDGWTSNYWNDLSGWLKSVNLAISVAKEKEEDGTAEVYNDNIIQISRIWRAYLMSELTDNWGPAPIEGFQGENPEFNSVEEVYNYMLAELKDAVEKIDPEVTVGDNDTKEIDIAYEMDWEKWIRYANSMRMRLAMRIAEVDPATAQENFEDAVKEGKFISTLDENFAVTEKPGWDALTGVMSRGWNEQILSETLNNMMLGLGGVKSADQNLTAGAEDHIKPENYIGLKFEEQFPTKTNDPSVGYFLDGLPYDIDPRAYKNFYIPGDKDSPEFSDLFEEEDEDMIRKMKYEDGTEVEVDTKFTWSTYPLGEWGAAEALNEISGYAQYAPAIADKYRNSENERIFFASWDSYFLIAEAALKGWNTSMSDKEAYEKGIEESFSYNGVSQFYSSYIESTDYSRVGTSVKYDHTAQPGSTHTMKYIDGKSGNSGTVSIKYPENTIYEGGNVNNDKLTKIITQKAIANTPWLPLETWNDHRRLGLPFFENPAVENSLSNLPNLNGSNYMENSIKNFPQRLPYPSGFRNNDPKGYEQAVNLLGGADEVLTPLWWAQQE